MAGKPPPPTGNPGSNPGTGSPNAEHGTALKTRLARPRLFKVLLLNDDYTPMEFVVSVLQNIFAKSETEATEIMLQVHRKGVGLCGVFTHEIAETKLAQVMGAAAKAEHPLRCTMEPE